jgi:hypothetical protein
MYRFKKCYILAARWTSLLLLPFRYAAAVLYLIVIIGCSRGGDFYSFLFAAAFTLMDGLGSSSIQLPRSKSAGDMPGCPSSPIL